SLKLGLTENEDCRLHHGAILPASQDDGQSVHRGFLEDDAIDVDRDELTRDLDPELELGELLQRERVWLAAFHALEPEDPGKVSRVVADSTVGRPSKLDPNLFGETPLRHRGDGLAGAAVQRQTDQRGRAGAEGDGAGDPARG